jgi:hypothetical protein
MKPVCHTAEVEAGVVILTTASVSSYSDLASRGRPLLTRHGMDRHMTLDGYSFESADLPASTACTCRIPGKSGSLHSTLQQLSNMARACSYNAGTPVDSGKARNSRRLAHVPKTLPVETR